MLQNEVLLNQLTRGQSLESLRMPALGTDASLATKIPELAQQFFGSQGTRVGYLAQAYMDPSAVGSAATVLGDQLAVAGATAPVGGAVFLFAVQAIKERLQEGPRRA